MHVLVMDISSLYAYKYMVWSLWSSGHSPLLWHWDIGLPLLPLHNFLLQKGRQGFLWQACRKYFPYICCLPHTPPTSSAWSNQTGNLGGGIEKKSAPIIWHPTFIYCAHIITLPAHIRNLVWATRSGFGPSYLFQQKYPHSFIGFQILQKH